MKLSTNNPIIRLTRWLISKKGFNRLMPKFIRYGGWLFLFFYKIVGINVLLLTSTGRKSGKPRTTPVMFLEQDQDLIIAAHYGGSDRQPNWYLNLLANPAVSVEIFWRRRAYQAEAIKDEKERKSLLTRFPFGVGETFQEYTKRSIPIIRL